MELWAKAVGIFYSNHERFPESESEVRDCQVCMLDNATGYFEILDRTQKIFRLTFKFPNHMVITERFQITPDGHVTKIVEQNKTSP
jgi:hypothetical protein